MNNKTKKQSLTLKLCESAIMIALATILSLLKLVDLPFGGSITFASMLPIVIIAYRYGTAWGLFTATVHGIMQFILGASVLSYVTGWKSVCAVILFDYVLAFALIGLAGLFKNMKSGRASLVLGSLVACLARYACHFISGVTVWRDLSIPGDAAVVYSFVYNATYMIPETAVLCLAAFYIGSVLTFSEGKIGTAKRSAEKASILHYFSGACVVGSLIFDIVAVFSHLQNPESGEFDITGITSVNWPAVVIVTLAGAVIATLLTLIPKIKGKKS
ncbi:MAG: energy-coupled thiamine transporter ThiT [Clostridia bacterium]|nr:energy-coupled thiamine transporter ThiT [Clostridia bacterium]